MDFNADGNMDMIAAGFGGFCYYFEGKNDGTLKQSIEWKDKSGKLMQCGYYYDAKARRYALDKSVKKEDQSKMDHAKAVDWNNDGDYDLIFSEHFSIKLRINEGTKQNPVFATKDILIYKGKEYHYILDIADWDGDGLFDLIGSGKKGGVYLLKNTGKKGHPKFETKEQIFDMKNVIDKNSTAGCCEVSCFDYNMDGKLDLVVGLKQEDVDPEFKMTKEKKDTIRKCYVEIAKYQKKLKGIYVKYLEKYKNKDEANKYFKTDKEGKKLYLAKSDQYRLINKLKDKFIRHGYIYVLLRK